MTGTVLPVEEGDRCMSGLDYFFPRHEIRTRYSSDMARGGKPVMVGGKDGGIIGVGSRSGWVQYRENSEFGRKKLILHNHVHGRQIGRRGVLALSTQVQQSM